MIRISIALLFLFAASLSFGQSDRYGDEVERVTGFHFGPKIGATLGNQAWNEFDRNMMFNWHAAAFMESFDPDLKGSLFAQFGYHSRGSALRLFSINGGFFSEGIVWNNLSLTLGAKKRIATSAMSTPYYFVGIRGEYSVNNNLEEIQLRYSSTAGSLFYPLPDFSRRFVYGLSFGGGFEFTGNEYIQPAVELTISPDFAYQYESPLIPNIVNPFDGRSTVIPERRIRNITLELSVIVRFKREVILIE